MGIDLTNPIGQGGDTRPSTLIQRLRVKAEASLPRNSLRRRLAGGAMWSLLGGGISQCFIMVTGILLARSLGKSVFGELGIIQSTVGMLGVFAGMSLGMTSMKYVAQLRTTDPTRAGRIIGVTSLMSWVSGLIIAVGVAVAAPYLATHTMKAPHLAAELRWGCLLLLLNALNGAQLGALSGLEAFKSISMVSIMSALLGLPLAIAGAHFWRLPGVVLAMTVATGAACIISFFLLRRECERFGIAVTYRGCLSELPVLWKFSLPALIAGAFFGPVDWVLKTMLVSQPGGYEQLGVFNAASQWQNVALYVPNLLSRISLPVLSNLWGNGELSQCKRVLTTNTVALTAAALLVALPVAIASPYIMKLYGPGFTQGYWVLVFVCFYSILWAANMVVGQAVWAMGYTKAAVLLTMIRAVVAIGVFWLYVTKGALELSQTYAITYVAQTLYTFPFVLLVAKRHRTGKEPA